MAEEKLKLEDLLGEVQKDDGQDRIEYVAIIGAGVMGTGNRTDDFVCGIGCCNYRIRRAAFGSLKKSA